MRYRSSRLESSSSRPPLGNVQLIDNLVGRSDTKHNSNTNKDHNYSVHDFILVPNDRSANKRNTKTDSKRARVVELLHEAVNISPYIPPHESIPNLVDIICKKIGCERSEARDMIKNIPGHSWFKRGRKPESIKNLVKQISII